MPATHAQEHIILFKSLKIKSLSADTCMRTHTYFLKCYNFFSGFNWRNSVPYVGNCAKLVSHKRHCMRHIKMKSIILLWLVHGQNHWVTTWMHSTMVTSASELLPKISKLSLILAPLTSGFHQKNVLGPI